MRTVLEIADELRAMAHMGLFYCKDPYDQHRYLKLLELSSELASMQTGLPLPEVQEAYLQNLTHVSPLVGADAVVMKDQTLLLIQRQDSGLWALPGGLIDVGESPAAAAVRELFEETGLESRPLRLLGVFDSQVWKSRGMMHFYEVVTLLEVTGGTLQQTLETRGAQFFPFDRLPPLDGGHQGIVPRVIELLNSGETHLDTGIQVKFQKQQEMAGHSTSTPEMERLKNLMLAVFQQQSQPVRP